MIGGTAWLGSQKTATAPGQLILGSTAQERCSVVRLIISVTDAAGQPVDLGTVSVADIKVGTTSQFVGLQPMPASVCAPSSQANNAGYGTGIVEPGTDFSVIIANAVPGFTYNAGAICEVIG